MRRIADPITVHDSGSGFMTPEMVDPPLKKKDKKQKTAESNDQRTPQDTTTILLSLSNASLKGS